MELNETHDPARRSWIAAANDPAADFPIQNLPLGVFRRTGEAARGGVAIGDRIFDLAAGLAAGLFSGDGAEAAKAACGSALNPLMALGNRYASALRAQLSALLRADSPERPRLEKIAERLLLPMAQAQMQMPAEVGGFTDFLTSTYHTERLSRAARPDNPLPPSFKYLPIAYNSRASSVRVSGEAIRRPNGQFLTANGEVRFGAEPAQDFELEVGCFIGVGNQLGAPISIAEASDHIFGFCLLNDWSARGIQRWESFPLGPFLGKSLSTTISPWVVTAEAIAPFRCPAFARAATDPRPFPHLSAASEEAGGGIDLNLEAFLITPRMREQGAAPARLTATNFKHMYWTFAQMVTHHASNGCNLRPGDLFGSGTTSGPTDESRACMAELSVQGSEDIVLPNGERRRYLLDGDEVIFRARATRDGAVGIGFGECRGHIDAAPALPK